MAQPQIVDDFDDGAAAAAQPTIVDDFDAPVAHAAHLGIVDDFDEPDQPGVLSRFAQGAAQGIQGLGHAIAHPVETAQGIYANPRQSVATAARVGLPIAGAVAGSLLDPFIGPTGTIGGAGVGGLAGSAVGTALEGREQNAGELALDAALGGASALVPGVGGALVRPLVRGAEGAALGGLQTVGSAYMRGEPITAERLGAGVGVGGVTGMVMGIPEGLMAGRAPRIVDDLDVPPPVEPPRIVDDLDDASLFSRQAPDLVMPEPSGGGARPGSRVVFPEASPAETTPSQPVRSEPMVSNQQPPPAAAPGPRFADVDLNDPVALAGGPGHVARSPREVPLISQHLETLANEPRGAIIDKLDEIEAQHPNPAVGQLAHRWSTSLRGISAAFYEATGREPQTVRELADVADRTLSNLGRAPLTIEGRDPRWAESITRPGQMAQLTVRRADVDPADPVSRMDIVRLGIEHTRPDEADTAATAHGFRRMPPPGVPLFNVHSAMGLGPGVVGRTTLMNVGRQVADRLGLNEVWIWSDSRVTGVRGQVNAGSTIVPPFPVRVRRAAAAAGEEFTGTPFPKTQNLLEQMRGRPAEAPPAPAGRPPEVPVGDARVSRVPIEDLHTDEARFQTRVQYGAGGESGQLRDVGRWDDESAGNVGVWRDPADGRLYIVEGHNRYALARRLGERDVRVMEIQAPTAEEAAARGALINMRGGSFNEIDVANFLRHTGLTADELEREGIPLTAARNRDGMALANLHPALFGMVARGEMPIRRGALLGREFGNSAEGQAQQLAVAQLLGRHEGRGRGLNDAEVQELIRGARGAGTTTETQNTLFGEEQLTRSNAIERAQVVAGVRQMLRQDARLFGTVSRSRAAERLEQEGSQIDVGRAQQVGTEAAQVDELLSRLANRQGPVSDVLNDAARRVAQGEPLQRVVADALPAVRRELLQFTRGPQEGGPGDSSPGGQGGLFGNERGSIQVAPEWLSRKVVDLFGRRPAGVDEAVSSGSDRGVQPGGSLGDEPAGVRGDRRAREEVRPVADDSLLNRFVTRRRPGGTAEPPREAQGVLLYGPDDRPLVMRGPMSAHDPDQLAPSFRQSFAGDVDERLADMQQRLAEYQRDRVAYARRHVVPVRQTYREADALRTQIDAYAERNALAPREVVAMLRRQGEAVNAAGIEVLNGFNVEASVNARAASARALIEPSATNRQAAREAVALLLETQPQRAGGLAEAGRALNIARYPRGPEGTMLRAMRALERDAGGAEAVDKMIDLLARIDPNDTVAINRFVRAATSNTWRDKLYEAWINALLSGPVTQVKNALSNAINQPIRIAERAITGVVDPLRATLTGTKQERFVGEAAADLIGTAYGVADGVRAGLRAFQTEIPSEGAAKFLDPGTHQQAIKGTTGRLVRLPARTLLAFDEFFKAMTFRGELAAQAYRRAAQEGHVGSARRDRMAEILATPDQEMIDAASTAARYWAFQQRLGEGGQAVINLRNKVPGLSVVIPFVQTPVNVAKFGLERTPLSLGYIAAKAARGELRGGELSEQAGRMLVGTAIAGSIAAATAEGLITGGGPRDPNERRAWLQTHQPYSVKVGDQWISYGSLEPLGITVGLVADAAQVWNLVDQEDAVRKAATTIATSLGVNLGNKTFLRGVSDMMSAYMDPDRYGERWIESLAGTLVPSGAAQLARAGDPTVRRPSSLEDLFRSRIPGMREQVAPVRDIWGEPLRDQGLFDGQGSLAEFAERALSPVDVRRTSTDAASREVARLAAAPSAPQHSLELARERVSLTDQEWDSYVRDSGQLAKRFVTKVVESAAYRGYDDETKREAIRRAFADARASVRDKLKRGIVQQMRAGARR